MLALLSSHLSDAQAVFADSNGTLATSHNTRPLSIPPLSCEDSHLTPNEYMSGVVAVTSSWIDLCSPDPLISDVSRQVLSLEIEYAAFCGVSFIVLPGPKLHHGALHAEGVMYYARAIQEVLSGAPYIQIHIWLRMIDNADLETNEIGDLAPFARAEYMGQPQQVESTAKVDMFGTWDAWNVIRSECNYHSRLFVGKACKLARISSISTTITNPFTSPILHCILFESSVVWHLLTCLFDSIVAAEVPSPEFCTIKMVQRARPYPEP